MARLPVLHKRSRSKGQRALDLAKGAATVWTTVKASSAGARAAKRGAKAYGAAKGAKVAGRPVVKLLAVPAAVVGGVAVWRAAHRGHDHDHDHDQADTGRPLGPVASADTVSPPASATEAAERAETEHADSEQAEAHAS
ncbi:MAG: hypothetical protein V7607_3445 [Solirubrobacteraceae bacterium]